MVMVLVNRNSEHDCQSSPDWWRMYSKGDLPCQFEIFKSCHWGWVSKFAKSRHNNWSFRWVGMAQCQLRFPFILSRWNMVLTFHFRSSYRKTSNIATHFNYVHGFLFLRHGVEVTRVGWFICVFALYGSIPVCDGPISYLWWSRQWWNDEEMKQEKNWCVLAARAGTCASSISRRMETKRRGRLIVRIRWVPFFSCSIRRDICAGGNRSWLVNLFVARSDRLMWLRFYHDEHITNEFHILYCARCSTQNFQHHIFSHFIFFPVGNCDLRPQEYRFNIIHFLRLITTRLMHLMFLKSSWQL